MNTVNQFLVCVVAYYIEISLRLTAGNGVSTLFPDAQKNTAE